MREWAKGNSRSVNHENLSKPMKSFSIATHNEKKKKNKELDAIKHTGYWKSMDTVRDRKYLEQKKKKKFPWNLKN